MKTAKDDSGRKQVDSCGNAKIYAPVFSYNLKIRNQVLPAPVVMAFLRIKKGRTSLTWPKGLEYSPHRADIPLRMYFEVWL